MLWVRRPSTRLAAAGLMVALVALAARLVSRTVGMPSGANVGVREPAGIADALAAMFDVTLAMGLLALVWRPLRRFLDRRVVSFEGASLGVMMAIVALSLLVLFGIVAGIPVAIP